MDLQNYPSNPTRCQTCNGWIRDTCMVDGQVHRIFIYSCEFCHCNDKHTKQVATNPQILNVITEMDVIDSNLITQLTDEYNQLILKGFDELEKYQNDPKDSLNHNYYILLSTLAQKINRLFNQDIELSPMVLNKIDLYFSLDKEFLFRKD